MRRLVMSTLVLLLMLPCLAFSYDSQQLHGNDVTPLVNGTDIFKQVHSMIQKAKTAIHIEMYEFQQMSIANELIAKKKAGLEVQVLLDRSSIEMGQYLSKNGIQVKYFRSSSKLDHVKLLSVDGNLSLIGGMNWGNHSPMNHDADILIKGPAANDINQIFATDWTYAGGTDSYTTPTPLTTSGSNTISNVTSFHADIKKHVLDMINQAKDHLYLEIFILTDDDVKEALANAADRGVDVRLLLDPKQPINATAYTELKNSGIQVLYYAVKKDEKFHIKLGISDSKRTIVGSCNWSRSGFYRNNELNSDVLNEETADFFEKMFVKDWSISGGSW